MKPASRNVFIEIVTALFVLLFLYTALTKFRDLSNFIAAMQHSTLIGPYATWLAWTVPTMELIIVAFLIIPRTRGIGLMFSTGLMAVFTAYVGYNIIFESKLPCTCGGIIETMTWPQHLVFNTTFLLLGIGTVIALNKNLIAINRSSRIPV